MSDDVLPDTDGEDGIPPGKRLVRAGGGAGLSLGERLAAHIYRLTWRTPLHAFRLKGRHPLKFLAAPVDPVGGDAGNGQALMDGRFHFEGESVAMGEGGPELGGASAALIAHYHSFAWLRDVAAAGPSETAAPLMRAWVAGWLKVNGDHVQEPAWSTAVAARRLLHWPSHAPALLGSNDLVFRSAVLNGLARMARHVDRAADRTPPGLDRIATWCGIVAAGLVIAGGEARRAFGEAGLAKALASGLSSDGGILSRSPREQCEVIDLLSHLRAFYDARSIPMPKVLSDDLARAVPPLLGVLMGDGGPGSWQGTPPFSSERIQSIVKASGERARPLRQAREWGYQRLSGGPTVVLFDAAPPPHSRTTRTGCASTLALEVSDGPHRLIVNCGGASAAGLASVPGLAEGLRTTAAHSTMTLADTNSTAVLSNGSLGKGVDAVELDRREADVGSRVEASHDGYAKRFGFTHGRSLALSVDGREVRGEDTLIPVPNRRKAAEASFAIRFHVAPDVDLSPTADAMGALLRIDGGALWQFRTRGGALTIEPSLWVDGNGAWHQSKQLVISGEAASGGATIGWVFKRAG
jgi:uncharacterized heparinase superfamily protein